MAESDKNTVITRNKKGQFVKGNQEGNRQGRPKKGHAIADMLNEIGDSIVEDKTRREKILEKVYKMAEDGDLNAIKFIADRTEGRPQEFHQLTTDNISPYELWKRKLLNEENSEEKLNR
jgi:hypothetical protein